jgi:hypothetical protein
MQNLSIHISLHRLWIPTVASQLALDRAFCAHNCGCCHVQASRGDCCRNAHCAWRTAGHVAERAGVALGNSGAWKKSIGHRS